jgi:hypothetical protein
MLAQPLFYRKYKFFHSNSRCATKHVARPTNGNKQEERL